MEFALQRALLIDDPCGLDGGFDDAVERDRRGGEGPFVVEAREEQEVVDQLRHAVCLVLDRAHRPGEVLGAAIGAALYITVLGLFALGLGARIRNTAGAIAALVATIFVLPALVNVLPPNLRYTIGPYLPINAGNAITSIHPAAHTLATWSGFGILCAYAAASLIGAALLLRRRDV